MVRRETKIAAGLAAFALLAAGASAPAQAYQTWDDRRLTYGVSGQKYWIGPEAQDLHTAAIQDAVASWNATSTPVSYARTTTKSQSRLDFTRPATDNGGCANVLHFVNTTSVNNANGVPQSNWWWAKVQIRPALRDTDACGPVGHRRGILAHEVGHAMGLAHVNGGADRIMQRTIAWSEYHHVNTPRPDDIAGINYLY